MHKFGIFRRIFFYTLLFLTLAIGISAALFSQQFVAFYDFNQFQQVNAVFQPFANEIDRKGRGEIIIIANSFHEKNQSFHFYVETIAGEIIYSTPGAEKLEQYMRIALPYGISIRVMGIQTGLNAVKAFASRVLVALLILFAAGIAGAALFARGITRPIRRLAEDTHKMAALEYVAPASYGKDEIGQLGGDVQDMYEKLKQTITALEKEIEHVREMEENQRYFFSAASHELKTPIAAATVMIEGMLADIGDYHNHPRYLRECLKTLASQSKIITEIIDIVNLSDSKILPMMEKINLSLLVAGIMPEYEPLAESKSQTITISVADHLYCMADKNWLARVLSNIFMNAIQNSPDHESIRIWTEEKADVTALHVLNTGVSIHQEVINQLFEPFFRLDKARSRSSGRSGLGLTIVKKMLDSMGILYTLNNVEDGVLFTMVFSKA